MNETIKVVIGVYSGWIHMIMLFRIIDLNYPPEYIATIAMGIFFGYMTYCSNRITALGIFLGMGTLLFLFHIHLLGVVYFALFTCYLIITSRYNNRYPNENNQTLEDRIHELRKQNPSWSNKMIADKAGTYPMKVTRTLKNNNENND